MCHDGLLDIPEANQDGLVLSILEVICIIYSKLFQPSSTPYPKSRHVDIRHSLSSSSFLSFFPPPPTEIRLTTMVQNLNKSTKKDATPPDRSSIGAGVLEDAFIARKENEDDAILRANGHEAVMPRQFNWLSALGLGFSITNSWIGYLVSHHGR